MLVDDEIWIRKSLKKMITDTELPLEVVCEAKNAKEALLLMDSFNPDIIITDMKMPESDGIVLMDNIYSTYKHIKVIVVSGYSEYDYMKKAISINAVDYLLKPITPQDLNLTLQKVINNIVEEKQNAVDKEQIETNNRINKEMFLQNLSASRIAHSIDIKIEATKFNIPLIFDSYCIVILGFRKLYQAAKERFYGNIELLIHDVEKMVYNYLKNNTSGYVFKTDDRTNLCVLLQSSDSTHIKDAFNTFSSYVKMTMEIDLIAGVSSPFTQLINLNQAFTQAMDALYNNSVNLSQSYCFYNESNEQKSYLNICNEDIKILSRAIVSKNTGEIKNSFTKIIKMIRVNESISLLDLHKLYLNLIVAIKSALNSIQLLDLDKLTPYLDIENIRKVISFSQFNESMTSICDKIVTTMDSEKSSDLLEIMKSVEAYIEEHYNEDISLVDVACHYHFEPTYFSKIFKSVMNVGFTEYLISKRIENACRYLTTSTLKINDISVMVGYDNPRYFSQIFKKFTGYTPSQYRSNGCTKR